MGIIAEVFLYNAMPSDCACTKKLAILKKTIVKRVFFMEDHIDLRRYFKDRNV